MVTLIPLDAPLVAALQADAAGAAPPWTGGRARDAAGAPVGTCAFKAPPQDGAAEIARSAFGDPSVARLHARTGPAGGASSSILRRPGFVRAGHGRGRKDGPVWAWARQGRQPP